MEFSELDKPRVHFLRKVLHILLMETEVEDLGVIFARFVPSVFDKTYGREKRKHFHSRYLRKALQIVS